MNILGFGIGNLANPDLFIILLIVLVLFGANKLPGLARSLGQSMNEFRKAPQDLNDQLHNAPCCVYAMRLVDQRTVFLTIITFQRAPGQSQQIAN
jgi:TatA/E family protein of Tat protein translocase